MNTPEDLIADTTQASGSCLCRAVRFTVYGPLTPPEACHCRECRKQSGHVWAATTLARTAVEIDGLDHVSWYQASPSARRGFCPTCGSFLFWQSLGDEQWIDVAMGAFDGPTHVRLARHIFVAEQGDYYGLDDGVPQSTGPASNTKAH